jgi:nucleoside-diphosphate-sugar epimerase
LNVFITGVSGFVGTEVSQQAKQRGWKVWGQMRKAQKITDGSIYFRDISPSTTWYDVLSNIDCVIHCAARVHQMEESGSGTADLYHQVNTEGTLTLARQAAEAGVRRFIFISSVKVNGEWSEPGKPFISDTNHIPSDPYALSKYNAEEKLRELAKETGLEVVIIRPPLVYGPGVKANFLSMMKWIRKGIPLPLGRIHSQRSLVFVGNLANLILECCSNEHAIGKTFLVSDDHDISVSDLLRLLAKLMGRRSQLWPLPQIYLEKGLRFIGKGDIAQRLCGNLQLDIRETKTVLNWQPPMPFEKAIESTVKAFLIDNGAK